MTALRLSAASFALASCALATAARAADAPTDVDISRITLSLPGGGWTVSGKLPYALALQDSAKSIDGERRLLSLGQPGTASSMVMLVSATRGHGGATVQADCDPDARLYVHKYNTGISTYIPLQCLRVQGPVRMPADLSVFGEPFAAALSSQHAAVPPEGYVVALTVSNNNGAIVEVVALVGRQFVGLDARAAVDGRPSSMPEGVAAWGDKLGEEALGTLSSWSGRMTLPPVAFKPPAAPPQPLNTAQAAATAIKD